MKNLLFNLLIVISLSAIPFYTYADWQCYASDKAGHTWGSAGSTQERATAVAMSFCSSFSPDGDSCQPNKCISQ